MAEELVNRQNRGDRLGQARIVPILNKPVAETGGTCHHVEPRHCYLGQSETMERFLTSSILDKKRICSFLPLARNVSPLRSRLLPFGERWRKNIIQVSERRQILNLLRSLAENLPVLKRNRELFNEMKRLRSLASKELPSQPKERSEDVAYHI